MTGGAGFIGSHTVDALVAAGGYQVSILDDLSAGKREQINPQASFNQADLRDAVAVKAVIGARAARDYCSSGGADGRAALGRRPAV